MKLPVFTLVALLPFIGITAHGQSKDEMVKIIVTTENRVLVQANKDGPRVAVDEQETTATADGKDISQCDQSYGQSSLATGRAKTLVRKLDDLGVEVELRSWAFAQGGHFRTCVGGDDENNLACNAGFCVGNIGHDKKANANVSARATLEFRFPLGGSPDYLIRVSKSGAGELLTKLRDAQGTEISLERSESSDPILSRVSGGSYYLDLELPINVIKNGMDVSDVPPKSATARIQLIALPVLYGKALAGLIAGGHETIDHPYVGALRIEKILHCSGTVVGSHTVLTAAHCIHRNLPDYAAGRVEFVFGNNSDQYEGTPYIVASHDYPKGGIAHNGLEYVDSYNEITKQYVPVKDDIALIYFEKKLPVDPLPVHETKPTWDEIAGKISLTFVGYGATLNSKGRPTGWGTKREATWYVDAPAKPYTFSFHLSDKSTCGGDSGGPALVPVCIDCRDYLVSGVTSTGTVTCTAGINTRVDAYKLWLNGRIR
ncbi:MAG: trypsin-like serine protease [Nitrosospira sp.]